jgi:hypothetical protein
MGTHAFSFPPRDGAPLHRAHHRLLRRNRLFVDAPGLWRVGREREEWRRRDLTWAFTRGLDAAGGCRSLIDASCGGGSRDAGHAAPDQRLREPHVHGGQRRMWMHGARHEWPDRPDGLPGRRLHVLHRRSDHDAGRRRQLRKRRRRAHALLSELRLSLSDQRRAMVASRGTWCRRPRAARTSGCLRPRRRCDARSIDRARYLRPPSS